MKKRESSWKPGESGNPKGRPRKPRALTRLLTEAGELPLISGGEMLTGKEALARRVWEFVATGQVKLGGTLLKAESVADWLGTVKWLYTHIDGGARPQLEREDGEVVVTIVRGLPDGE